MKKILQTSILMMMILSFSTNNLKEKNVKVYESAPIAYLNANHDNLYKYLSDIDYVKDDTYVKSGYYLRLDKNSGSGLITVNIDGEPKPFIKGISAWATSNIVYDLKDYDYDYFTAYLGVDSAQTNTYYNSGVSFTIKTSLDGTNWEEVYKSKTLKAWDNAESVRIDIRNVRFLALYAYENGNSWYSHWYDDAVYANAKLVKEEYVESEDVYPLIKTLDEYDTIIKNNPSDTLSVLQREFVKRVGYDILQALCSYSDEYKTIFDWLMNDESILKSYLLGGEPDGNYASSLKILNELYNKYSADLEKENKKIYENMMISLSLTHSANVGLWVTGAPEDSLDPNGSNALKRYEIFKDLYENNLLRNDIFENIEPEEMRFVMNNIIDDEEIKWLNAYTKETNKYNPYNFISYRFGYDYNKSDYFDYNNYKFWDDKYHLSEYGLTYQANYPKLWSVFEEGAVCGGISKTGSNICGVYGVPSTVISQPGHAAYIYMDLDSNGQKVWNMYNDVSGWAESGKTEKLSVRMPNGWGSGTYAGNYPASYILLSQSALNDYDNYALSEEVLMQIDVYKNDYSKQEELYNEALSAQKINFDAWLGLVKLYEEKESTEEEFCDLAERIANNLTYFPLPMHDLLRLIEPHITSNNNMARFLTIVNEALNKATKATSENVLQPGPTKTVANYLLQKNETELATFSFDGENASKIVLASRFKDTGVVWEYNLTSGVDENAWIRTEGSEHLLTQEELQLIHPETDIKVRIVGALENVYNIDITKFNPPNNVYINDLENKIYEVNDSMEWQENDGKWISFGDSEPILTGEKTINVRYKNNKSKMASEEVTFEFTDNDTLTNHYIPVNRLEIHNVSSEELTRENNSSKNAIDGNLKTMWHTMWDGSDKEKYIVIKLDKRAFISSLEYVPREDGLNGVVKKMKVSVSMDGENWQDVLEESLLLNNDAKTITLEESTEALYVKITGLETSGEYMSASMINLFEDLTKITEPTAQVIYDHTQLTNKDVVAKLVNPSKNITVTNNENSLEYTFMENGEFTFQYVDDYGNVGTTKASVDWIDKDVYATISYEDIPNSSLVKAVLNSDEDISVLNNDGKNSYVFAENGEFTFQYQDKAGNTSSTMAKVDWLDNTLESPQSRVVELPEENGFEKNSLALNDPINENDELEINTDLVTEESENKETNEINENNENNETNLNEDINKIELNEDLSLDVENNDEEKNEVTNEIESNNNNEIKEESTSKRENNDINEDKNNGPLKVIGLIVLISGILAVSIFMFHRHKIYD